MEADTLREAAGRQLEVGCAVSSADLQDPKMVDLITSQFGCLTPEYEMMPDHLVDDTRHFTFEAADHIVAFAQAHGMPVFGHMLVWHHFSPRWLFEKPDGSPLPREEALSNLRWYVTGVVGHFRGKIKAWNVVNEAVSDRDDEFLRDTPARRAIGDDYLAEAFASAHAADPQAELYYNDYNIEQPAKLARTLRLVRSLQTAGVRLDAVGIQGHWLLDWPPADQVEKAIDTLAATGVRVMVTELDVDPLPRRASGADMAVVEHGENPYPGGLPAEMQEKLARRYGDLVAAIVRHPAVTTLSFWGTHDGRSWLNNFPVKGRTNHPLLFDRALRPKPAFATVVRALEAAASGVPH